MKLLHSGKVRDVYADGDDLVLVASDRVSIYDVVLPTAIPDKGAVLTQLSLWWFDRLGDLVPNHVISGDDVPPEFAGRAMRCRRLDMLPVECVARGYLTGGGLTDYEKTGAVSGVTLPPGLVDGAQLPEPIFTPSTKAETGHDEAIDFDTAAELVGDRDLMTRVRDVSIALYEFAGEHARERGVILADTKFEFGLDRDGSLTLMDEVLTPDSSRFWPVEGYEAAARVGGNPPSFDKQFVRDWLEQARVGGQPWNKRAPAPALPAEVVEKTADKYREAFERLVG